jgi:hypothetical protein
MGNRRAAVGKRRTERECGSQKCATADGGGGRKYKDGFTQHDKLLSQTLVGVPEQCGHHAVSDRTHKVSQCAVNPRTDFDQIVITTFQSIQHHGRLMRRGLAAAAICVSCAESGACWPFDRPVAFRPINTIT